MWWWPPVGDTWLVTSVDSELGALTMFSLDCSIHVRWVPSARSWYDACKLAGREITNVAA